MSIQTCVYREGEKKREERGEKGGEEEAESELWSLRSLRRCRGTLAVRR